MIHRASLAYLRRGQPLPRAQPADLDEGESHYLQSHLDALSARAQQTEQPHGFFRQRSSLDELLTALLSATEEVRFLELSDELVGRLHRLMQSRGGAKNGVLAVVTHGARSAATEVSVMKLEENNEAAQVELKDGRIKLTELSELLPPPGKLQKGLAWPDPRDGSEVLLADTNAEAATYFLEAFDIEMSARPREAVRELARVLVAGVPPAQRARVLEVAASLEGSPDVILAAVRDEYPQLATPDPLPNALAPGRLSGRVPPGGLRLGRLVYKAGTFELRFAADQLSRIAVAEQGDGWTITITVDSEPRLEPL